MAQNKSQGTFNPEFVRKGRLQSQKKFFQEKNIVVFTCSKDETTLQLMHKITQA